MPPPPPPPRPATIFQHASGRAPGGGRLRADQRRSYEQNPALNGTLPQDARRPYTPMIPPALPYGSYHQPQSGQGGTNGYRTPGLASRTSNLLGGGFQNRGGGTGLGQRPEMQEQTLTDDFLIAEIEQDRQNRLLSPTASQMNVQNNDASVILAEKNRLRIASAAIMQEREADDARRAARVTPINNAKHADILAEQASRDSLILCTRSHELTLSDHILVTQDMENAQTLLAKLYEHM